MSGLRTLRQSGSLWAVAFIMVRRNVQFDELILCLRVPSPFLARRDLGGPSMTLFILYYTRLNKHAIGSCSGLVISKVARLL